VDTVRDSLEGLALGDGFGECWFQRREPNRGELIAARTLPAETNWRWTDDTALALAVVLSLRDHGRVVPTEMALDFAEQYTAEPWRGFAAGMHELMPKLAATPDAWEELASSLFGNQGSFGNGAAMRSAPLGAYWPGEVERVIPEAALASRITHAHPEGVAAGVAVAVGACIAAASRGADAPSPTAWLREITSALDEGPVRDGLLHAAELPAGTPAWRAAELLGSGSQMRGSDTAPFALWSAAHHLDDLVEALWTTAEGLGDVDTTCAITGGVVAARTGLTGVPAEWLEHREDLPEWVAALPGSA
jgi:ADP-ribosylglycohydrolase